MLVGSPVIILVSIADTRNDSPFQKKRDNLLSSHNLLWPARNYRNATVEDSLWLGHVWVILVFEDYTRPTAGESLNRRCAEARNFTCTVSAVVSMGRRNTQVEPGLH